MGRKCPGCTGFGVDLGDETGAVLAIDEQGADPLNTKG